MSATNSGVHRFATCDHDRKAMVEILDRVGDKWTIMIVSALYEGPMRYRELHRQIGNISQRMLTLTLKGLAEYGLVSRTVYPTIPPQVEYALTELGHGLRTSLIPLRDWASHNIDDIRACRMKNGKHSSWADTRSGLS